MMRVPLSDVVQPIAIPKNIPDFHQIVNILIEECHLMIRLWSRSDGIENHRSPVLRPVPKQLPSGLNVLPVKDAPRDEVHLAFEYHRLAGRRGGFGCDSSGKDGLLARLDVYSCHVSPDRMNPPEPLLVYFIVTFHFHCK